jgi:hypothetical protein
MCLSVGAGSALGSFYCVDVGSVTDVSEVYSASIFMVEVSISAYTGPKGGHLIKLPRPVSVSARNSHHPPSYHVHLCD